MRAAAIILALSLSACATAPEPAGGVATYDVLKRAADACQAKGGTFQLKKLGDSQYVQDYACERK